MKTVKTLLAIILLVLTALEVRAERASQEEMELVCQNWLSYTVYQKEGWAGETRPQIVDVDEIAEGDTVLARCFSIAPRGYVVVPVLKELPPIKAYSEDYRLDVNQRVGFPQLLREVLLHRIRLYVKFYGSLDAVQPTTGDVLLGREHKEEWNRFLKSQQEFELDLSEGKFQPLSEVGPLLTTSWDQNAPYNNFCPMGDGGRCVVGCVATAAAQIMKYHNWPPYGNGSHSYTWDGDQSCGGTTPSQVLSATFSDSLDWANMLDDYSGGYTSEEADAVAELCYEVGVAFEMDYGVCGSGIWTYQIPEVMAAYHTYFKYDSLIAEEDRNAHTAAEWFSIIKEEINSGRPMQYFISRHSIVCDGWRDTGGQNQYHINYGWGGPHTAWYTIDNIYCPWGCDPMEEFMFRHIFPFSFAPAVRYSAGNTNWSFLPSTGIFCADLDGDGDLDLAVANSGGGPDYIGTVSILKNYGDGTFQPKVDYDVGRKPNSVFCADLDGDGDLDLAVANSRYHTISILKNNGDGTFQPKIDYDVLWDAFSVFCADLDDDSDMDLVVAITGGSRVGILKNRGNGDLDPVVYYYVNSAWSVFCADLDGDFDLDIAVGSLNNRVSILMNYGDGTFQGPVDYPVNGDAPSLFCADLDRDSDLDIAASSYTRDSLWILKNNGDGTFPTCVGYRPGQSLSSVFCADLNGDLHFDLAIPSANSWPARLLKNKGDATFPTLSYYQIPSNSPRTCFCADLDGDLDLDLAMAGPGSYPDTQCYVSILKNLTQIPANSPPSPFPPLLPGSGYTTSGVVSFDWANAYDPNLGDQIRYDLYVSTVPDFDPEFTTVYDSLAISQHTDTLDVGTFYWKVKAYDNWGAERWSTETWSFYTYYICGDVNCDSFVSVTDIVYLIAYKLYTPPGPPPCWPMRRGDVDGDGVISITDIVYLIAYKLYTPPGPPPVCGGNEPSLANPLSKLHPTSDFAEISLSEPKFIKDGFGEITITGKFDIELAAVQLEVNYDPKQIELIEPALSPRCEGLQIYFGSADGQLKIGILDINGEHRIPAGEGPILTLKAKANDLSSLKISEAILVDQNANAFLANVVEKFEVATSLPDQYSLHQNYPNPFNPETQISYDLPNDSWVKLSIYNIRGQKVKILVDGFEAAGHKTVIWDGKNEGGEQVASGVYFYRLDAGEFTATKKMVILR